VFSQLFWNKTISNKTQSVKLRVLSKMIWTDFYAMVPDKQDQIRILNAAMDEALEKLGMAGKGMSDISDADWNKVTTRKGEIAMRMAMG
jgi:hypothetical protein